MATVDTVVDAIKAKTDNLPAQPAAKTDVQITVNADGIDVPTVSEIWNHTSRTLTSGIPTVSEIQASLAKTADLSGLAKTSDLSGLATALSLITALLDNWSVSENVLTVRNSNGTTLKTYNLTRDADDNIIGIVEN